jgi:hypothetical protein
MLLAVRRACLVTDLRLPIFLSAKPKNAKSIITQRFMMVKSKSQRVFLLLCLQNKMCMLPYLQNEVFMFIVCPQDP